MNQTQLELLSEEELIEIIWKHIKFSAIGLPALVVYLHHLHHVGYFRLKEVLRDVFGLEISVGALVNAVMRSGELLEGKAKEILQVLRNSKVVRSDETGARVKGQKMYGQGSRKTKKAVYKASGKAFCWTLSRGCPTS